MVWAEKSLIYAIQRWDSVPATSMVTLQRDDNDAHDAALVIVLDPRAVAFGLAIVLTIVRIIALHRDDDDPCISALALAFVGVITLCVSNLRHCEDNGDVHIAVLGLAIDPCIAACGLAIVLLLALHVLDIVLA